VAGVSQRSGNNRVMSVSLTPLSKNILEKEGYTVERVEHFNWFTKRRVDLLGVADLIALNGKEILLVQVTSRNHLSTRRKKAKESDKLKLWLKAGGKIIFHGWDKKDRKWRIKTENL
jgi:hypothetical protein